MHCGSRYRLGFERQSAKDNIDVDAGFGVTKEQHASAAGKFESILDAREDAVGLRGSEQPRPLVLWNHGKCVYVTRCAGSTEDRRRDAADDHCRDMGRLEPLGEIGESGDKEPRNPIRHGNA
jgi:hypothetical protein